MDRKETIKQAEEKILYRGVAIYKTKRGYEPNFATDTLEVCKNIIDVMLDGICWYPAKDICGPREKIKQLKPEEK